MKQAPKDVADRLANLKLVADLLNAEAAGDLQAKARLDQMINAAVSKIDAVAAESGSLEDACKKHGVPLSLFRPMRVHVAAPRPMHRLPVTGMEFAVPTPMGSCGKSPEGRA